MDLHLWTNGNIRPGHSISLRANQFLLTTTKSGYLHWYSLWIHFIKYIRRTWKHKNIGQRLEKWETTMGLDNCPYVLPYPYTFRMSPNRGNSFNITYFFKNGSSSSITHILKTVYMIVFWKIWLLYLISHPYGQLSWNNHISLLLIFLSLVAL